jgi:hypothetical protein
MLFVERNKQGKIIAVRANAEKGATEHKTMLDEEIVEFLSQGTTSGSWLQILSQSDVGIIRILEDIIDLLVEKNIIMFTELPEDAQTKLRERKMIRTKMGDEPFMVDGII